MSACLYCLYRMAIWVTIFHESFGHDLLSEGCLSGGWSSSHSILPASFQLLSVATNMKLAAAANIGEQSNFHHNKAFICNLHLFDTTRSFRRGRPYPLSGWPQCCRFRLSIVRCVNNENTSANFFCKQGRQTQISVFSVTQLCFSFVHGLSNLG